MPDRAAWVTDITTRIPVSAWGSFKFPGLPYLSSPKSIPPRNTVCVDNYDTTRNTLKGVKGWYPSPYMTGVQAIYDVSMTDRAALLTHVFPVTWYETARKDLRYLLANKPKDNYASIAWTIHTGWLVYHMLLASNIYPTLWADALQFAKNRNWVPPAVGWNMSLPTTWRQGDKTDGYPDLVSCWLWTDPGRIWTNGIFGTSNNDWEHKVQPGSFAYYEKQLWWSGSQSLVAGVGGGHSVDFANLGISINEVPWSGKTIYATYAPALSGGSLSVLVDTVVEDWAKKNSLSDLQARARFFHRGGLVDLTKVYAEASAYAQNRLKNDWTLRANALVDLDYWTLVRGGVQSWQYRSVNMFTRSEENTALKAIILMPACRQDLKVVYNEFMKSWRQSFIVSPMVKFATWLVNSAKAVFRGDFIGAVRAQVDLQKWGKQYAEQTANAPADPYFFFCTVPPLFLRSPGDAFNAFKDQVAMDETKTIKTTGTEALFTLTERSIRLLEKTFSLWLWAKPEDAPLPGTVYDVKDAPSSVYVVKNDPSSTFGGSKFWWGVAGVSALTGFLFWRRK